MRTLLSLTFLLAASIVCAQNNGIIIDKYGQQFPGILTLKIGNKTKPDLLVYQETATSKKERLTVDDLRAFTIDQDSFLMLRKFKFPLLETSYDKFAKVVLRGREGLLCTFTAPKDDPKELPSGPSGSGAWMPGGTFTPRTITYYIVQRKGEFLLITDFNFYHEMPGIVADYAKLKEQIVSKKVDFDDMEKIIEAYETWRKSGRRE